MANMQTGPLIETELEADLDRFASWLANAEGEGRRRRTKARRDEAVRLYRERMAHLLRRTQRITPSPAIRLMAGSWLEGHAFILDPQWARR